MSNLVRLLNEYECTDPHKPNMHWIEKVFRTLLALFTIGWIVIIFVVCYIIIQP